MISFILTRPPVIMGLYLVAGLVTSICINVYCRYNGEVIFFKNTSDRLFCIAAWPVFVLGGLAELLNIIGNVLNSVGVLGRLETAITKKLKGTFK